MFIDNEDVISLVGHKGGIFHQLDEEIKVPRGSSKGFYNKLVKNFTGGTKQHVRLGPHHPGTSYFTVKHYAGDVKYDYHGFLEKNKDTLFNDLVELMSNPDSCSNSFVRQLFSESAASTESSKSTSKKVRRNLGWRTNRIWPCLPPCFLVSRSCCLKSKLTSTLFFVQYSSIALCDFFLVSLFFRVTNSV